MTYKDLKIKCENSKRFISLEEKNIKKYKKEIIVAKRFYNNGRDLYKEFEERKDEIETRYVIPYLLEFTDKITDEPLEYIQVKDGASGGIDVDSDFQPSIRDKIFEYLQKKYGEDRILHIITFSKLGILSATKDLMRVFKLGDFKTMNNFTKCLDSDLSWEENVNLLKAEHPTEYKFYLNNKEVFDLVPKFLKKVRGAGVHAGGIAVLDRPVYDLIPIERVNGKLVTAIEESSTMTGLDDLGIIKFDMLSISILDVISKTFDLINEKLFLIEEDGIKKIVPETYINKEIESF